MLLEPADVPVDDPAEDEAPADIRTGAALDREDLAVYLVGELNLDRHELLLLDRVIDRRKDPKVRRCGVDTRLILPIVRLKGLVTRLLVRIDRLEVDNRLLVPHDLLVDSRLLVPHERLEPPQDRLDALPSDLEDDLDDLLPHPSESTTNIAIRTINTKASLIVTVKSIRRVRNRAS